MKPNTESLKEFIELFVDEDQISSNDNGLEALFDIPTLASGHGDNSGGETPGTTPGLTAGFSTAAQTPEYDSAEDGEYDLDSEADGEYDLESDADGEYDLESLDDAVQGATQGTHWQDGLAKALEDHTKETAAETQDSEPPNPSGQQSQRAIRAPDHPPGPVKRRADDGDGESDEGPMRETQKRPRLGVSSRLTARKDVLPQTPALLDETVPPAHSHKGVPTTHKVRDEPEVGSSRLAPNVAGSEGETSPSPETKAALKLEDIDVIINEHESAPSEQQAEGNDDDHADSATTSDDEIDCSVYEYRLIVDEDGLRAAVEYGYTIDANGWLVGPARY